MPRPRDELTAGEWAVLAVLAESSTHGFAIARAMAPAITASSASARADS
jgi:hypothetical protein